MAVSAKPPHFRPRTSLFRPSTASRVRYAGHAPALDPAPERRVSTTNNRAAKGMDTIAIAVPNVLLSEVRIVC